MSTEVYDTFPLVLQALGVLATGISAWFVIRQLKEMRSATRAATKATQFNVMQCIAELMKSIDNNLYNLPDNIVYHDNEFPDNPPPRYERWNLTAGEHTIMNRAREKRKSFFEKNGGHEEFEESALKAINALNDIAQYIEDGYANYADVLGQYHFKIIRIVHIVEAFRCRRSGDYGHRILRLRQQAKNYHYMHPKHSDQPVAIDGKDYDLLPRLDQTEDASKKREDYRKAFERNLPIQQ